MKKIINKVHGEGLVYESTLESRVAGERAQVPGSIFISGKISLQVDEDNVVTFDFLEGEKNKNQKENKRFQDLKALIGMKTIVSDGEENATKLRIDSALSINDFIPKNSTEMISAMRNFNGFVHTSTGKYDPKATFETDLLISNKKKELEKNDDGDMVETGRLEVIGYTFSFKGDILPVKFYAISEAAIKYFVGITDNTFTKVWGKLVTEDSSYAKVEKSAFGEDKTVTYTRVKKRYVLTGANVEAYDLGDESVLTVEEVKDALAARKVYLESRANQSSGGASAFKANDKTETKKSKFDF